jgi:hypothetical protein
MTDSSKDGVIVNNNIVKFNGVVKQEIESKVIAIQSKVLDLILKLK